MFTVIIYVYRHTQRVYNNYNKSLNMHIME